MSDTGGFADIIAMAAGDEEPAALEDLVNSYEKDSVQRALKHWKRSVVQILLFAESSSSHEIDLLSTVYQPQTQRQRARRLSNRTHQHNGFEHI
jgi:hypothetical protein